VGKIAVPDDIEQQPQFQGSLVDQLRILTIWANRLGLYDAADLIRQDAGRAEVKE
jgi:hypothetical protein